MVSFIFASNAILCAKAIHKLLLSVPDNIEFNLSLVSGKPIDETDKIVDDTEFGEIRKELSTTILKKQGEELF